MQATANKTIKAETIAEQRYGVNIYTCTWEVVEWTMNFVLDTCGTKEAAKQWKRINNKREKMGRYTRIPEYGTELFQAYFA